jgi:hypothetical protein
MKLSKILFENGSIPKPSRDDLYDAIEMAKESYGEELENVESLSDFDLTYLGKLDVSELREFADLSSWMEEFDEDDVEGMKRFRGEKWFNRMENFAKNDTVPPIIVVEGDGFLDIGDGRGRVTYANWRGIPLHVWKLKVK